MVFAPESLFPKRPDVTEIAADPRYTVTAQGFLMIVTQEEKSERRDQRKGSR